MEITNTSVGAVSYTHLDVYKRQEDICQILSEVLFEFPISEIQFFVPKWVEMLPRDHKIKQDLIEHVRVILERLTKIRDALGSIDVSESEYIDSCKVDQIGMGQGCVNINKMCIRDRAWKH